MRLVLSGAYLEELLHDKQENAASGELAAQVRYLHWQGQTDAKLNVVMLHGSHRIYFHSWLSSLPFTVAIAAH